MGETHTEWGNRWRPASVEEFSRTAEKYYAPGIRSCGKSECFEKRNVRVGHYKSLKMQQRFQRNLQEKLREECAFSLIAKAWLGMQPCFPRWQNKYPIWSSKQSSSILEDGTMAVLLKSSRKYQGVKKRSLKQESEIRESQCGQVLCEEGEI